MTLTRVGQMTNYVVRDTYLHSLSTKTLYGLAALEEKEEKRRLALIKLFEKIETMLQEPTVPQSMFSIDDNLTVEDLRSLRAKYEQLKEFVERARRGESIDKEGLSSAHILGDEILQIIDGMKS